MIPAGARLGPMTIAMLWIALSAGLMMGIDQGYHADSAAEAEIHYDSDERILSVGDEDIDVANSSSDEQLVIGNESADEEFLSETGERWLMSDDSPLAMEEPNKPILPDQINEPIEERTMPVLNSTVDMGFEITADAADLTADFAYNNQNKFTYNTLYAGVTFVTFVPPLAVLYVCFRRVIG